MILLSGQCFLPLHRAHRAAASSSEQYLVSALTSLLVSTLRQRVLAVSNQLVCKRQGKNSGTGKRQPFAMSGIPCWWFREWRPRRIGWWGRVGFPGLKRHANHSMPVRALGLAWFHR